MDLKIGLGLRIRSVTTFERRQRPVHIRCNRGEFNRLLPFPQSVVGVSRYTDDLSGKD